MSVENAEHLLPSLWHELLSVARVGHGLAFGGVATYAGQRRSRQTPTGPTLTVCDAGLHWGCRGRKSIAL